MASEAKQKPLERQTSTSEQAAHVPEPPKTDEVLDFEEPPGHATLSTKSTSACMKAFHELADQLREIRLMGKRDEGEADELIAILTRLSQLPVSPEGLKAGSTMCPQGHLMEQVGVSMDDGWLCDGKKDPGGCKSGITGKNQSKGMRRHRCERCSPAKETTPTDLAYNLCDRCTAAKACCAFKEVGDESVQRNSNDQVREIAEDLLLHWKEFLAYSPGLEFDHVLNSFTEQAAAASPARPLMWREDQYGGCELSLSSSRRSGRPDEAEKTRVTAALRSQGMDVLTDTPTLSGVKTLDADMILFRVENSKGFCDFMAKQQGLALQRDKLRDKGVLGRAFSQYVVNEMEGAVLRDKGPHDYISLRIGSLEDNDRFIALLKNAEKAAAYACGDRLQLLHQAEQPN